MEFGGDKETSVREYVRVIFKHKLIIVSCCIVIISLVYFKQEMITPYYTASVKMQITGLKIVETDFYSTLPLGGKLLSISLIELVKTKGVIERVVNALKLYERNYDIDEMANSSELKKYLKTKEIEESERALKEMPSEKREEVLFRRAVGRLTGSMSVSTIADTNLFIITVKDFNPNFAPIIANSLSRSYIIYDLQQQLEILKIKYGEKHTNVIQIEKYIEDMYKTLDGRPLPDIEAMGPASVKVIGQALSTVFEGAIDKRAGLIIAFLISLFAGISLAYILEYFDQTYRSPHDIEKYLNMPFLGSIPKIKALNKLLIINSNPGNKYIKFYQNISYRLDMAMKNKNIRSILITDAEASKDTATVIANVGYYLAHRDKNNRVLIIDANLRNPLISKVFSIADTPGLVDILEGKILFEYAVQDVDLNVHVLSAGRAGDIAADLLDSSIMSDIIKSARDHYDVVLISCADLINYTDAVKLSSLTDAFVLVLNEGKVRRFIVKTAISQLEQKKVQLVGVVLNNRRMVIPRMIYKWI